MSCDTYCEHGGVCMKDTGHEGNHSSGFCVWKDDESISKDKADAIMITKGFPEQLL